MKYIYIAIDEILREQMLDEIISKSPLHGMHFN